MSEVENPGTSKPDAEPAPKSMPVLTKANAVIAVLVLIIVVLALGNIGSGEPAQSAMVSQASAAMDTTASEPVEAAPPLAALSSDKQGIQRNGEGRLFYTTITIPANAETLYLSGSGAAQKADGTWGNMEEQAIATFNKFKNTLESQGWSMSDIVQVRAFATAGEYGLLDFDGFNRGYSRFFGTEENPQKPVRSFVQVADLVVDGWLVEIEIRAARVPDAS